MKNWKGKERKENYGIPEHDDGYTMSCPGFNKKSLGKFDLDVVLSFT